MALVTRKQAVAQILPDSGEKWGGFGMPVIVVASPLAGSGRTMLAAHLAVEAGRTGNGPVVLLDPVPGGALTAWLAKRNRPTPESRPVNFAALGGTLVDLEQAGTQLCILETMSTKFGALNAAIAVADIVLIPCPLEPKSLKAAAKFAGKVRNAGAVASVIVTRPPPGEEFWNAITRKLKAEGLLCAAVLHHDEDVEHAMGEGLTVGEAGGDGPADGDVRHLWRVLAGALPQPPRRPRWTGSVGPRAGATHALWASQDIQTWSPMRTVAILGEAEGDDSAVFAAHLAVQAIRSGAAPSRVRLVETEMQSPLVHWTLERGQSDPVVWPAEIDDLPERLRVLRESETRFCFVHIAPERIGAAMPILESADLLVLPVRCDRGDEEIGKTVEALREICGHHGTGGPAVAGVLLRPDKAAGPRAKALASLKGAGIFRLKWGEEPAMAMRAGATVMESDSRSLAAREFVELWAGLRKLMGGK